MPDYKKDAAKFFPWEDEEGRKRKSSRGDSIPPKTSIQSRLHSKPKIDGQEYLDMYIRTKEKERSEKYGEVLAKRQLNISESWRDLKKDMVKIEKELPKVPKGGIDESEPETAGRPVQARKSHGHMKAMNWNY